MTSKEAIQELYNEREYLLGEKVNNKTKNWHNDITHYDNIGHCLLTIREELERLEKLEKENQKLKEIIKDNFGYEKGFTYCNQVYFKFDGPVMEEEIKEILEND